MNLRQWSIFHNGEANAYCKLTKRWLFFDVHLPPGCAPPINIRCEYCEHHEFKKPTSYFKRKLRAMLCDNPEAPRQALEYIQAREDYEKRKREIQR